jgi:hypothetical protein
MTDRKLLERAAKAAGVVGGVFHEGNDYLIATIDYDDENDCRCFWNPLEHNHQAFELAVKLRISVEFGEDGDSGPTFMAGYFIERGNRLQYAIEHETQAQDANAATRRAIVRAAAAMAPTGEPT